MQGSGPKGPAPLHCLDENGKNGYPYAKKIHFERGISDETRENSAPRAARPPALRVLARRNAPSHGPTANGAAANRAAHGAAANGVARARAAVAGAVWIPDGALVSARFSDYVTEEAALDLSQAELDEGAALLAAALEAGEDAPRGGAFLGTRLRLEVRTEGGETCAAALDPVSDGRVNVTLARGGEREARVLVSADLAAWVQRVTGWKLASAEEIAAIERAETLEGQAVDPAIVEALRAHAAPENAVPSDGLSDPVYLRLELADGSTLRAAVDAACGDRFAIENQVYRAAEDFYTYDIDAGALAPA